MEIKAIGFDLDDTLYNRSDVYKNVFQTMEKKVIKTGIVFEEFNEVFEKNSQNEYNLYIRGEQKEQTYRINRVILTYRHFGFEISENDAIIYQKLYEKYKQNLTLRDGAEGVLNNLKNSKYELFLLTNGPSKGQREKIQVLNLEEWFDENKIFISDEIGYAKPDNEIFQHVERNLEHHGKELLYIGDDLDNDILSAKKMNWDSIYFREKKDAIDLENKETPIVSSFKEIFNILQNIK